jgi:hypothetical protein
MSEAARQRVTKRKMNILAHQYVIKKVLHLYFCLVVSCPYQLMEVDRDFLENYLNQLVTLASLDAS